MTNWIMQQDQSIYKTLKALIELNGVIDQSASSGVHSGDFVFLYLTAPIQRILFKTVVIDEDILHQNLINDRKYFKSEQAFKDYEAKNANVRYVRLKVIEYFDEDVNAKLTLNDLRANGYGDGNMQGSIILENNKQLFDYIESIAKSSK